MMFLRAILHLLWMMITIIPWSFALMFASLFSDKARIYAICRNWWQVAVQGGNVILGIHNRVLGLENLPQNPSQGVVLLVKHQSAWEALSIPTIVPFPIAYVFKRELLYVPFVGWSMARADMIYIDRKSGSKAFRKLLEDGKRLLSEGTSVILFPEGTRIARGQTGEYKTGGARLAIAANALIVPVAVTSAKNWPKNSLRRVSGMVDISFGKPISTTGKTSDEVTREVQNWIETEMRRLDPEAYSAEPELMSNLNSNQNLN